MAEVTSDSTRRKDLGFKKNLYERLGVTEYFLFDPYGDYLKPPLQGFRLASRRYCLLQPGPDGSLVSITTGIEFRHEGLLLRLTDIATGELFLHGEEESAARRLAEERFAVDATACFQAEARIRALEEELTRLRAKESRG